MKKGILKFLLVACGFVYASTASAQCDTIANVCAKHLETGFISDGQQYRALLLNSDETAEFHATFYGGSTYRIAACSGLTDGNLIFSVYDSQRNLLFTNKDYSNAAYWDFKVTSTLDCTIEAHLDPSTNQGSGCAVILIGFKQ
ncbi:MAG: hypothetical protein ABI199_08675 [Bacteroidia bacterium]